MAAKEPKHCRHATFFILSLDSCRPDLLECAALLHSCQAHGCSLITVPVVSCVCSRTTPFSNASPPNMCIRPVPPPAVPVPLDWLHGRDKQWRGNHERASQNKGSENPTLLTRFVPDDELYSLHPIMSSPRMLSPCRTTVTYQ